jgi:hypothetical protein
MRPDSIFKICLRRLTKIAEKQFRTCTIISLVRWDQCYGKTPGSCWDNRRTDISVHFWTLTRVNSWPPDHNEDLALKTSSFRAQAVLGISFIVSFVSYSAVPEVSVEGLVLLKDLCPFLSGDMSSSTNVILCPVIQGCINPGLQVVMVTKFCRWLPIFSGPQYGPCFKSPSWRLEFWGGSYIFAKFVHPYSNMLSTFKLLWLSEFPFTVQYCNT